MLYTRSGDSGSSNLWGNRLPKSSLIFEALGALDELNSFIGLAVASINDEEIKKQLIWVQQKLFIIQAEVSGARGELKKEFSSQETLKLEQYIDKLEEEIGQLKHFVLPGGIKEAALFDVIRTVARRAERSLVELNQQSQINPAVLTYINRLSSLFFALARVINKRAGIKEQKPTYE
ncbi:cob(I)yrinic acid a,c-diamide adenosyltransferase [Candidatus Parcubacteria bacterium]|nr:MAG: cob(I)yrinic acid a,c-diamide adenosyltransferase [Candidatus Parcubacteria bacterium]